ncbi:hypothetical protein AUEXF2481DRAFT_176862 [Aureobasidium subglaciale EXF-2481]|uniref:Uncharacterized protein n=1 Tax=Aureobasidium subglaciale (strain EXF-2481) TaxID=1043005 RepID=A0A074YTG2_AURSE|nr:uncharacterized protein AUEXF2481DRAFT_176862 [Aureobasidium subglaciale EXF-2481]KEQ99439.1 hypothetical protein AUEXF2481DRAFT_176862 [Aureobasidium subglaciale EXF-2481]
MQASELPLAPSRFMLERTFACSPVTCTVHAGIVPGEVSPHPEYNWGSSRLRMSLRRGQKYDSRGHSANLSNMTSNPGVKRVHLIMVWLEGASWRWWKGMRYRREGTLQYVKSGCLPCSMSSDTAFYFMSYDSSEKRATSSTSVSPLPQPS